MCCAGARAFARQLFEHTKDTYSSSYIEGASVILSPGSLEHLIRRGMDEVDLSIVHLHFNNKMGIKCNIVKEVHYILDNSKLGVSGHQSMAVTLAKVWNFQ